MAHESRVYQAARENVLVCFVRNRWLVLVPLLIGTIGLVTLTRNPRFQTLRAVDLLPLLGSGMCFGVALAALLSGWRMRR